MDLDSEVISVYMQLTLHAVNTAKIAIKSLYVQLKVLTKIDLTAKTLSTFSTVIQFFFFMSCQVILQIGITSKTSTGKA